MRKSGARPVIVLDNIFIYSYLRKYDIHPDKMAAAAEKATLLLKALSHPHRLMLLCQMIDGERSVGDLAASLELRESTASQHLSLLRRDGLVRTRREGQTIWYAIASPAAQQVMQTLFEVFCATPSAHGSPAQPGSDEPTPSRVRE